MMTSRSDVSKMLVSHHSGHAGSVVSSSSHQTQATSRLSSRLEHQKNKTSKKKSLNSISVQKPCVASHHHTYASQVNSSTEDRSTPSQETQLVSSPKPSPTEGLAAGKSYGFLQMKCLEILKAASSPMSIHDIQLALGSGVDIVSDRVFSNLLKANPRISINSVTKRLSFKSPYENITGPDYILSHLKHRGFEINSEALEFNKNITRWVNQLLSERRCRAVRATRVSRCKVFSSESGFFCNLYSPETRCEACKSLQGVILYPLGPESVESVVIDVDLKELWHKIPHKTLADLKSLRGQDKRRSALHNELGSKKRKPAGGRVPRVQKIANLHMYTQEEINQALTENMS